jgi:hypothetical protein
MEHKSTDFERVITGDESWFSLYDPCHSVWAALRDAFPYWIKRKLTQQNA